MLTATDNSYAYMLFFYYYYYFFLIKPKATASKSSKALACKHVTRLAGSKNIHGGKEHERCMVLVYEFVQVWGSCVFISFII